MKQKDLKKLLNTGKATELKNYKKGLDVLAITTGTYGRNGLLLQDRKTKRLYVIIGRTSLAFQY